MYSASNRVRDGKFEACGTSLNGRNHAAMLCNRLELSNVKLLKTLLFLLS